MNQINDIAKISEEQATAIQQINLGIDQIASVVQTNSATAEQSATASEELSSQANVVKEMVGKFRLKEESVVAAPIEYSSPSAPVESSTFAVSAGFGDKY